MTIFTDATFEHDRVHADCFIDECPACHEQLAMLHSEIESYLAAASHDLLAGDISARYEAKVEAESVQHSVPWHEGHTSSYSNALDCFTAPKGRPVRPSYCLCERDSICVAHYRAKVRWEHERSVADDGTLIEIEPPAFSDAALDHVYAVYHRCPATIHFTRIGLDESLAPDPTVTGDEGRDVESMEQHEHRQFVAHRAHAGLPWHRLYDESSPYLPDPSNVLSDSGWSREYAPITQVEVVATRRDEYGETFEIHEYAVLLDDRIEIVREDAAHAAALLEEGEIIAESPALDTVNTGGSVAWEYHRRSQGRQPWMPASTYRFVMDGERRRQRMQRLRTRIAALLRELGQDPKRPEIATWVRERGYEAAAMALEARAARERASAVAEDARRDESLAGQTAREVEV